MTQGGRYLGWSSFAAALCVLLVSGCASYQWPRIDPSGQRVLVWPQQPGMPAGSPPGAYAPPTVTFPSAPVPGPSGSPPVHPPGQTTGPGAPAPFTPPVTAAPLPTATVELRVTGPERAQVGTEQRFLIEVTNRGAAPATDLVITDTFEQGLEHSVAASPIQRDLGTLGPGQSQSINLSFRVTRPGRLCHTVRLTGAGGTNQSSTSCLIADAPVAERPAATFEIKGPRQAKIGETVEFAMEVMNTGTQPIPRLALVSYIDPNLEPTHAAEGHTQSPGQLHWEITNLQAGHRRAYRVQCKAIARTERACLRAEIADGAGLIIAQEACLEILPVAAAEPVR